MYNSCIGCFADAVLIPTPFYGVIKEDVDLYSGVKLYHAPLDCEVLVKGLLNIQCIMWNCV